MVVAETRARDAGGARRASPPRSRSAWPTAVGVPPDVVALVPPGAVPKTSSGKIRRAATRELYVAGALGRAPRTPAALTARAWCCAAAARRRAAAAARASPRALYAAYLGAASLAACRARCGRRRSLVPGRRAGRSRSRPRRRARAAAARRLPRCRVEGGEHLRGAGPVVLASNHASYVDVPPLLALAARATSSSWPRRRSWRWPLVGTFVRKAGHLTVDRFDVQPERGRRGQGRAAPCEAGASVLFFPEGTFTAAAGLRPFRLGAFKAAAETGVPVVPLALRGTRSVLRAGRSGCRARAASTSGSARRSAPEGDGWRAVVALRDRVADAIAAHCGEPRLDLVAGGPVRP